MSDQVARRSSRAPRPTVDTTVIREQGASGGAPKLSRVAGRYEIEQLIGQGGMASVYRVTDASSGQQLALKRLSVDASRKVEVLFQREYHTLATLRHPNMVQVHEYGTDDGVPYYTMELLEGRDLQTLPASQWTDVCRWLRIAASTLAPLHARRLIHRDLSPRNLWLTTAGDLKLIDFGAVVAFGVSGDVVGTPPFVPPEALGGAPLDQRADLYALGALGYWLLTGTHAYRAHNLRELSEVWCHPVAPPSMRLRELASEASLNFPPELDALILSLLSRNPEARPNSAAELMDRLDAIAGLPVEQRSAAATLQLSCTKFVGRTVELDLVAERLAHDQGENVCFKGAAGSGKTRLLRELGLQAQLRGAQVIHVEAELHTETYGVARSLAHKLLETLPERAVACAEGHAPVLAHLSNKVRAALGQEHVALARLPANIAEARVRMQTAFVGWLLALGREVRLVVAVDDLQACDDSSAAVLLELASSTQKSRAIVLTTFRTDAKSQVTPAALALRHASKRSTLSALTEHEAEELLGSAFGDAPNVPRLAHRLHVVSQGNPRHFLDLAEHLARKNVVGYKDGVWILPPEISDADLPQSQDAAVRARLDALPEEARQLARILTVRTSPTPIELCAAMSGLQGAKLFDLLDLLVQESVLVAPAGDYHFSNPAVRDLLAAELEQTLAKRAHLALGHALLEQQDLSTLQQLQASVHLLHAGDTKRAAPLACRAAARIGVHEIQLLSEAIPSLEQAATLLRAAHAPARQMIAVLAPLAAAGLYCHRRLAVRYGDEAIAAFEEVLSLPMALRLRPFLGRKLSLLLALGRAYVSLRRGRRAGAPSFTTTMAMFMLSASTLTGVCAICIDPKQAARYADALEPLSALGRDHIFSFIYDFCQTLAATVRDAQANSYSRWRQLLARLKHPERIRGFPESHYVNYLSGALYASGALESYRDGPEALQTAQRLDELDTSFAAMSAEKIRMLYYANRGDDALHKHHRQRLEAQAIRQGSSWQVEAWAPAAAQMVHLRTQDAMGMKHDAEQLRRLSSEIPSLQRYSGWARGTYLLLRGQAAEALLYLEACRGEERQGMAGWARVHGSLARAYNTLGRYEDAYQICVTVMDCLTLEDLKFTAMNLIVQTEFALAEAGKGEFDSATRRVAALLASHAPDGSPVTMGQIHEVGCKIARLAKDTPATRKHFAQMEHWYHLSTSPSLRAHCERTRRQYADELGDHSTDGEGMTTLEESLAVGDSRLLSPTEALLQLVATSGAESGFILYADQAAPRSPRHTRSIIAEHILKWAEGKLTFALDQQGATDCWDGASDQADLDVSSEGEMHYRFQLLQSPTDDALIGAVVAARPTAAPARAAISSLHLLARSVARPPSPVSGHEGQTRTA